MKTGEYSEKGDYHKNLDKNWFFYPVYITKMEFIDGLFKQYCKGKNILDLGCGEGVLVEKKRKEGFDIIGADLNYESDFVLKRNIVDTGFEDNNFEIILCLDVLEHLSFDEQEIALREMKRILKPGGMLILSLSNLAHFAARFYFLFLGKLLRTSFDLKRNKGESSIALFFRLLRTNFDSKRHKGERPISESISLIEENGFEIIKRKGIFPTFPLICFFTYFFPSKVVWWHRILNKFFAYPSWSAFNFLVCRNEKN